MSKPQIPKIDSIEKLARFWDTHDLTDSEDQLEAVDEAVFERETVVKVHLPTKEAEALRELAKSKGLHDADLIREWVLERVRGA